ncbi:hypothetical protein RND81_02G143300 [Saponaria officinalis]|uniref:BHLH domain-containing protein n=1 Tax=Saponaria officinalis TaxID=3572 RepID=A0AAW1MU83_SAPOF
MDILSPNSSNNPWFAELEEVDDPMLLQDFVGDCLVDYPPENISTLMEDPDLHYPLSAGSECNSPTAARDTINSNSNSNSAAKRQKPNDYNQSSPSNETNQQSPVQLVLSSSPEEGDNRPSGGTPKLTRRPRRLPDQCHNHIIAERQRRQNLSQRFIALSALIPGLKKMDKTSVLGEAITHMKQLQEKLKILEDKSARRAVDSVVVVQRSRVAVENDCNSSTTADGSATGLTLDEQLPEVEARFSEKSVMIKIHCQMRSGVLPKIMTRVEDMNLQMTHTNSMPFNSTTLDITIMTQMEPDFNLRPQEVVENLRSIF